MNAAQALVGTLKLHGVDRVFCVPGESFLAVLDALHDEPAVEVISCRHEGGAGFMAVADAKLTRRAGVAFVSRGPGATNASIALHVANQDATPFVLFIGQVERKDRGRGAFQEVDYDKSLGGLCREPLGGLLMSPSRCREPANQRSLSLEEEKMWTWMNTKA